MNKRIKKKRAKLGDCHIGDHVYTRKEITMINKAYIGYMNVRALYYNIKDPKLTRPRVKSLINYIYKNRMKYYKRIPSSFKYLRFARHLNESDTIPGGKTMKYNSSTFISTTRTASNSCETASMEVD